MQRDELRLECLKLAFRHDRHPTEVVTNAKILEAYLLEPLAETMDKPVSRGPGRPKKNVDNPNALD